MIDVYGEARTIAAYLRSAGRHDAGNQLADAMHRGSTGTEVLWELKAECLRLLDEPAGLDLSARRRLSDLVLAISSALEE